MKKLFIHHRSLISLYLIVTSLFYLNIYIPKNLMGDDVSLFYHSTQNPVAWFTTGYRDYFINYHNWTSEYTNYLRPFGNLYIFLLEKLNFITKYVHTNWILFLVSSIYILKKADFSLAEDQNRLLSMSIIAIILVFYPPFYLSEMTYQASFALDAIGFLLCISLIYIYQVTKNLPYLIIVSALCIYTKETTLPVAISVFIVSLIDKRYNVSISIFSIVIFWLLHRYLAFSSLVDGAQALNSLDLRYRIVKALSILNIPSFNVGVVEIKETLNGNFSTKTAWLFSNLFVLAIASYYAMLNIVRSFKGGTLEKAMLDVILVSNALFFMLIGGSPRLSYILYGFFILWMVKLDGKKLKILILLITAAGAVASSGPRIVQKISYNEIVQLKDEKLTKLSESDFEGELILINDVAFGFSEVEAISKIYNLNIVGKVNNLDIRSCALEDLRRIYVTKSLKEKSVFIDVPECAEIYFAGLSPDLFINDLNKDNTIQNNGLIYRFPKLSYYIGPFTKRVHINTFGKEFSISSQTSKFLYFDYDSDKWRVLEL